ncbi:MFS transporter [Gloeothece verrucosa]|uniref:Major facilitator superfamily MFS_1 n=1 Tax=Gloeothece verrucosa (strain PCC 7822) TaxID=497965 RepID=E0UE56_GLOV7|nr:MFS transporter [Gloeothece verrucosa]ADN14181.1 major facilitator superfamily MFS_1 [Gloeothece verrucosa PCC 7822]
MQLSQSQKNPSHCHKSVGDNHQPALLSKAKSLSKSSENTSSGEGLGAVLTNPRFVILWSGQVFSQLADKVYLVLMIALITAHFQAQDQPISGWVSAIMIAFTIPAVLFGSLAGVYVDRWPKKGVLVISNLLRGLLVLVIPPLLWLSANETLAIPVQWLPKVVRQWQGEAQTVFALPLGFLLLLVLTFVDSTLTQFFAPAEQAIIPTIVKRRRLLSANSLFTTTMMATLIIGFAIGEPLLNVAAHLGQFIGLSQDMGKALTVGGSYTIAGLILLLLRTKEKPEDVQGERPHVLEDIRDGIAYLSKNHRVRNALIQLIILFSVFAALSVIAVRLAETIPGMKAEQFGILLAMGGLGLACGAAVVGHWGQQFSHNQLSLWGSMGVAASLVGLSWSNHSLWLALITTVFLGFFGALVGVPMQTTIQAETPADMRGKVFGLQNNAVNIALSLPLALAGIAETLIGLQPVLIALAVLALVGGVLTWYISRSRSGS